MTRLWLMLTLCSLGCETPEASDTGSDTDAPEPITAEVVREGEAVVDPDFAGTEILQVLQEETILCEINLTLSTIAAREDCDPCDWAFDLRVEDATPLQDVYCTEAGLSPDDLIGQTYSYGYELVLGHQQTLSVNQEGAGWQAVDFAVWDERSRTFSYLWDGVEITFQPEN